MKDKESAYLQLRRPEFWIKLVFVVACILHFIHFFYRSSLWFDELTCALNIRDHSYIELITESLDYNQIAPVGFLVIEKLATTVIGVNDVAYRLFPFLCSIASLILFGALARHFFDGIPALAVFTLCAGSVALLFYGGEAKQYSGDIAASLFIVWVAVKLYESQPERTVIACGAFGGMVAILSSFPAACIAFISMSVILLQVLRQRIILKVRSFLIFAAAWGISSAAQMVYSWMVMQGASHEAMSDYWSRGFIPTDNIVASVVWILKRLTRELDFFLTAWMEFGHPWIKVISLALIILSIPGIVFLVQKFKWLVVILFSPLLTAILLSAFKVLPFDTRVAVYATWPVIFTGFGGLVALQVWVRAFSRLRMANALGLMLACPILLITILVPSERPPFHEQPMQLVLRELKQKSRPDDFIFVYFKSRHALDFYGASEGINKYMVGGSYPDIVPHLRQLDSLKGSPRVWFVYSQWTARQPFPDSIKSYLGGVIGRETDRVPDPHGGVEDLEAAAYLYDLSGGNQD